MKGKICVVIAIVLLALSLINASVVMAETLKYIPFPQEISDEFYYTDIEIIPQSELDNTVGIIIPIYGERAEFYGGEIDVLEYSCAEDAKKGYSCIKEDLKEVLKEMNIVGINTFGDESISFYYPGDYSITISLFRNSRFVVYMDANLDYAEDVTAVKTLPKMIDTKLEQIKVPTPTPYLSSTPPPATPRPTPQLKKDSDGDGVPDEYDYAPYDPNVQTKSDVKTPGFGAIFAIAGLFAVVYLLRRRK